MLYAPGIVDLDVLILDMAKRALVRALIAASAGTHVVASLQHEREHLTYMADNDL